MIKNIMNSKVVTVRPDTLLREAISLMDKYDYKEIPVVDEHNRILGVVSYLDILDMIRFRGDSKVESFMTTATTVKETTKKKDALKLMINSGAVGLQVVNDDNKIIGFLSDYDLLNYYKSMKELSKITVSDLTVRRVEPIIETANIGEARKKLAFNKVDRLPVVNNKGRFIGAILSIDLLRTFYTDAPEKVGRMAVFKKRNVTRVMDVSIEGLVRRGVKIRIDAKARDAIQTMIKYHIIGVVVVNNRDEPLGILERSTILRKIDELLTVGQLLVQVSGAISAPIASQIKSVVETGLKIPQSYKKGVREVKVHVKPVHNDKGEGKVEIDMAVIQDGGNVRVQKTGFDLMFTLQDCMDTAEQLLNAKLDLKKDKFNPLSRKP